MLIIDTETTGLIGYPVDRVLEIGIAEMDEKTFEVKAVYNSLVKYPDQDEFFSKYEERRGPIWVFENTDMTPEAIAEEGRDVATVAEEVRAIVSGKVVTAYNCPFDFTKFLMHDPWKLKGLCIVGFDIMDAATARVRELVDKGWMGDKDLRNRLAADWETFPDKWVRSADAYKVLCPDDPAEMGEQKHRALDDAVMEAYILSALWRGFR